MSVYPPARPVQVASCMKTTIVLSMAPSVRLQSKTHPAQLTNAFENPKNLVNIISRFFLFLTCFFMLIFSKEKGLAV
jgi:hypothetical protein